MSDIKILNKSTYRWTETRQREVTRMEEYEVERKETRIDIQMPLSDLRLLASCGDGTSSITVSMKAAGLRLRKILAEEGYSSKRYIGFNDED